MHTEPARAPAPPARIVLADDDTDMRQLVGDCLRKQGYEVREVSDGSQLLVRVEGTLVFAQNPETTDLFVTDVHMPGYTGLEVITGLREAGMKTPVIIMTAFSDPKMREQAKALGAAFLCKPFAAEELIATVREVLGHGAQ